ncbi:MAG: cation:dicarboxylase symporter family transporter [Pseudomonadota bacterium]
MSVQKYLLFDVENKYNNPLGFGVAQLLIGGLIGVVAYKLCGDIDWFAKLSELISLNFIKALTSPLTFILFCCFFDLAYSHREAYNVAFKSMIFIILTTAFAASCGLFFAWMFNPLEGVDLASFVSQSDDISSAEQNFPLLLVPLIISLEYLKIIFTVFADYTELSILYIFIAAIAPVIFLHISAKKSKNADTALNVLGEANNVVLEKVVFKWLKLIVSFLPITMIFIVAWFLGKISAEQVAQFGGMLGANVLSILSQQVIILILLTFITGRWVLGYAVRMLPAYFTAFSTRSSVATMEVTLSLSERAGIRDEYREFVIPFGATVNMNGTAAHVGFWICALAFSTHPDVSILWLWMATVLYVVLTAMGTAAIPGGSIALLKKAAPMVFATAIGADIPEVQLIGLIGLITVFDIIGDAFRTQANVFGDTMCMAWLEKKRPKDSLDEASVTAVS